MSSIKRKPHILKSERTLTIPRHLLFIDTETTETILPNGDKKQALKLGVACYYQRSYGRHLPVERWHDFYNCDSFWSFAFGCIPPRQKLWVIARNLSFDFTILRGWYHLRRLGYKLKFFHSSGTTTIISVRKKGSSIVFLDSMNWFRESLAKTGDRIGLSKLKIDFSTCSDPELLTYCRRDVEIELENFKLFIRFLEGNRLARLCYTRGSTAMAAYLLKHYTTKIYIHNNKEAIDLERSSYKGGRVECFYLGDLKNEDFYILDVNSLYPFVMRNNDYPVRYEKIANGITVSTLADFLKNKAMVAMVLINTNEPVYAVKGSRTAFPIGRFWTVLCTPELKYALAFGHIERVERAVIYNQENIFASYVDKFYSLRQDFKSAGVTEYEELCKYMLNSLYGKFGQKGENWKKIGVCPNEPDREELVFNYEGHRCTKIRYLLGEIFIMTGHEETFDSFPAIASHVTAYARLHLWRLMQMAGSGNYFYCDTDSIIVNEWGLQRLKSELSSTVLGGLKIVESCRNLSIRGLKDYSTATKSVIKGIRKNAVKIGDGVYRQEQWPSFRGLLRDSQTEDYTVKIITKHLDRKYTKGIVMESGLVVPFVLDAVDDNPRLLF